MVDGRDGITVLHSKTAEGESTLDKPRTQFGVLL